MAVKKFKPTTPGQRHKIIGVFKGTITATTPEKSLTVGKRSTGGRNAEGILGLSIGATYKFNTFRK